MDGVKIKVELDSADSQIIAKGLDILVEAYKTKLSVGEYGKIKQLLEVIQNAWNEVQREEVLKCDEQGKSNNEEGSE